MNDREWNEVVRWWLIAGCVFFLAAAGTATGCTWAWAWQRSQAYAKGYEERVVIVNSFTHETIWVKRDTPIEAEIQK